MKKFLKISLIVAVLFFTLFIFLYAFVQYKTSEKTISRENTKYENQLRTLIKKDYSSYNLTNLCLTYTDWSSTIRSVNNYNVASSATAVLENDASTRVIEFYKKNNKWKVWYDTTYYKEDIPDEKYIFRVEEIEEPTIAELEYTLKHDFCIPYEDGSLYKKVSYDGKIHYFVNSVYDGVYKTKNGMIYSLFNKTDKWILDDFDTYEDITSSNRYDILILDKEKALEIFDINNFTETDEFIISY